MSKPRFRGHCYAADDIETLQNAAPPGVFFADEFTGEVCSPFGCIGRTHGWLTEPVYGDPDPETGFPVVLTPGTRPPAVCLLTPPDKPIPALDAYLITPRGWQGWA